MKNVLILFTLILIPIFGYSQKEITSTNFLKDIKNLRYTTFDAENKTTSETVYKITSSFKTSTGKRFTFIAIEDSEIELLETAYHYLDQNQNEMVFTSNFILPPFLFDSYSNLDISIEEGNETLPYTYTTQSKLPEEQLILNLAIAPIVRTLKYAVTDRQLVKEEVITTPAGNFNCFVVESKTQFIPDEDLNGSMVQWIAPGIGLVKQSHYNLNGRLTGTTLLTGVNVFLDKNPVVQN